MSKRRKNKDMSPEDYDDYLNDQIGDMYQAPKGKKPKGKDRRKASKNKTAYWD